jgi:dTDP-4-dehydrorhamnose 3,5-epimerase
LELVPTRIPDVKVMRPTVFADERGFFLESWQQRKFSGVGIDVAFVQDNHSRSVRNTLRGLHYQIEQPQGKLVSVVQGSVFDVAVDLRRSSASFGQWVGEVLSDTNHRQMWIPPGFAHGFLVLSESADFVYKCTDYYSRHAERCIRWDDTDLRIGWPLDPGTKPLVSQKDAGGAFFRNADYFA